MSIASRITQKLAPNITEVAPGLTTSFVHQALDRAINGVGPLPGAAEAADKQLHEHKGDSRGAVHDVIGNHVRFAGAQGFVTNLGGLVTLAATVPANITGLTLLQSRMVAGIAHLRGYDLDDGRVRNAILATILGEESIHQLIKQQEIPGTPMAMATAPAFDPGLNQVMAAQVASSLISKVAGKRLAVVAGKRVPVIGGVVGASTDAYATWRVGRYADRELLARRPR